MSEEWTDETDEEHVICPYCKEKQWIDEAYEHTDCDETEEECSNCGETFTMRASVIHEIYFSARKLGKNK